MAVLQAVEVSNILSIRYFCSLDVHIDFSLIIDTSITKCTHQLLEIVFEVITCFWCKYSIIQLPSEPGRSTLNVLNYKYKYFPPRKYLSTSTFLFG